MSIAERGNEPDYVTSPEYWDGHTLEKGCCPPRETQQRKRLIKLPADIPKAWKLVSQSEREIREFLTKGQETVLRRFTQDMEFDASSLPDRSIFRFDEEALWRIWPSKNQGYEWVVGYGVINHEVKIESNPDFGILYFRMHNNNKWLSNQPSALPQRFTIGEVIHMPLRLERLGGLQIIGSAERERKPARQSSLSFTPQSI